MYYQISVYPDPGINISLVLHQVTTGTFLKLPGFTWYCPQIQGINLVALYLILIVRHPPPMIGGTCMCLSIVLFVNKIHYWLAGGGVAHYEYKVERY